MMEEAILEEQCQSFLSYSKLLMKYSFTETTYNVHSYKFDKGTPMEILFSLVIYILR